MTTTPLPRNHTGKLAHAYNTIAALEQALADLEAENARLKGLLGDCLDWMESIRSSGDCGYYWEWAEDEYTRGITALENKT